MSSRRSGRTYRVLARARFENEIAPCSLKAAATRSLVRCVEDADVRLPPERGPDAHRSCVLAGVPPSELPISDQVAGRRPANRLCRASMPGTGKLAGLEVEGSMFFLLAVVLSFKNAAECGACPRSASSYSRQENGEETGS